MLDVIGWDDVEHRVGERFRVSGAGGEADFTLIAAEPLPPSGRAGGAFRLVFAGPGEPRLDQATYRFEGAEFAADIFVVPIARDGDGIRYEAIFL